jgi:hypothetical protein
VSALSKSIALFLARGLLGLAGGIAAGIFVYPCIFLADIVSGANRSGC